MPTSASARSSARASSPLKKRRRIHVGPHVTVVFENRDTIRFQIQEMARVEKILTDEGIQAELRAYNPLIPEPGNLSATMFIELTTDEQLREWLPKLVGIERAVELRLGRRRTDVRCVVDADHESQLTREDITASVHYVQLRAHPDAGRGVRGRPGRAGHRPTRTTSTSRAERRDPGELLADLARELTARRGRIGDGQLARELDLCAPAWPVGILVVPAQAPPAPEEPALPMDRQLWRPRPPARASTPTSSIRRPTTTPSRAAKVVCADCPVQEACLEYAIAGPGEGRRVGWCHRA